MRKTVLVLPVLLAAVLAMPLAAQAHSRGDDGLRVKLEPPVNFAPTPDCPTGAAIYGVSLHGQIGSGTNCILNNVPAVCPSDVTAQFCQNVPVRMTLSFKDGTNPGERDDLRGLDVRRQLLGRSAVVRNGDAGDTETPPARGRIGLRRRTLRLRRNDVRATDTQRGARHQGRGRAGRLSPALRDRDPWGAEPSLR
jgi:hypothetical protein